MNAPRGVEARIQWNIDNEPGEAGQCARWTWYACGGNQDPPNPPKWGCPDANAVIDKARAAGVLFTGDDIPRGAWVLYSSSTYGHACLSKGIRGGKGDIHTVDPYNDWGATGTADFRFPIDSWGHRYEGWLIRYAGQLLPMSEPGPVYVDTLYQGSGAGDGSDSVTRLQDVLNHTSIPAPGNVDLPPTGYWGEQTTVVVNAWQQANGYPQTPDLTNEQADKLFASWDGYQVVHADTPDPEPEPEPEPEPPPGPTGTDLAWHTYSGKPAGTLTVADDAGYVLVDADTPDPGVDGLEWHMLYANCDITWDSGSQDGWIRVKYVREGGDATAYQDYSVVRGLSDFLLTAQHWEAGQAGVGGRWYVNVGGGISKVSVATRYVKGGGVPFTFDPAVTRQLETAFGMSVPVLRILLVVLFFCSVLAVLLALAPD